MGNTYNLQKLESSGNIFVPSALKNFKNQTEFFESLDNFVQKMPRILSGRDMKDVSKHREPRQDFMKVLSMLEVESQRLAISMLSWDVESLRTVINNNSMVPVIQLRYEAILDKVDEICAEISAAANDPDEGKFFILVVDNDSTTAEEVETLLNDSEKYKIVSAETHVEAVNRLEERKMNFMLLNIEIPGVNGFSLIEHTFEIPSCAGMPITFFAQYELPVHKQGAMLYGVDYMLKPVATEALKQKIESACAK